MQYVCFKRFKRVGASGKIYNIPRGVELEVIAGYITMDNEAVCSIRSESAYRHFSRNDDGRGLERGDLVYDIAWSPRRPNKNDGFRFTPAQIDMINTDYPHFIHLNQDALLFNYNFYNAEVEELQELSNKLKEVH